MKIAVEWLLEFVPAAAGTDVAVLADALTMGGLEVESVSADGAVIEIKATPNRGDCLSAIGVARELAAVRGLPFRGPEPVSHPECNPQSLPVRIDAPELCGRFAVRVLRGLDARAETPDWMKRRLEQSGQRTVSALVDISNYVMFETGQPTHVFDLAKLQGGLQVRWAHPGETIALLNEQTVTLDERFGVVADDAGPQAIAGIMGGAPGSVTLETTDVVLEAAFWRPEAIQGRARRLNFTTEAAHRFERGVDFQRTVAALERLTQLVVEICGTAETRVGPIADHVTELPERNPVSMRLERLRRILGVALSSIQVERCFDRLGFSWRRDGNVFRVTPPSYRFDLQIEVDLIEEVARIYGYDNIPAEPPRSRVQMRLRPEGRRSAHALRRDLAQAGYQELVNFSFVPEAWEADFGADPAGTVRLRNPIAQQHAVMRSHLWGGLVGNLRYNLNRQATRVRTFELGAAFTRGPKAGDAAAAAHIVPGVFQEQRLAALAYGPAEHEQWGIAPRPVDLFDVKGDLEGLLMPLGATFAAARHPALHPGRCARITLGDRPIGWIGELHPRLCESFELPAAPILFEIAVAPVLEIGVPVAREVPRFPALVRDIAVLVDAAAPAGQILDDLRAFARQDGAAGSAVRSVDLFDVFVPKIPAAGDNALLIKEKSLAFRVILQDTRRSLTDSDADEARAALLSFLQHRWGARVRQ